VRLTFFASDKPREQVLANAFMDGARAFGDEVRIQPLNGEAQVAETEVAVMVGVKSRELFHANWRAGVHTVMLDKGYIRGRGDNPVTGWEFWRVAVDGHHPTRHLQDMRCPSDRWDRFGLTPAPWRRRGEQIVFAGSSAKYHEFYQLAEPTMYAKKVRGWIRERDQDRLIVYRPKPSWREARPVVGMEYSTSAQSLSECLQGAHVMITHGSNACFEAVLAGVPCIVLGDAVAKPISSTSMDELHAPRLATDDERQQWFSNLAYLQWNLREMASGEMWSNLRSQLYA
jgi:hypothetical protein